MNHRERQRLAVIAADERIILTPAGEPLYRRDAARWAEIKSTPAPRTAEQIAEDASDAATVQATIDAEERRPIYYGIALTNLSRVDTYEPAPFDDHREAEAAIVVRGGLFLRGPFTDLATARAALDAEAAELHEQIAQNEVAS